MTVIVMAKGNHGILCVKLFLMPIKNLKGLYIKYLSSRSSKKNFRYDEQNLLGNPEGLSHIGYAA